MLVPKQTLEIAETASDPKTKLQPELLLMIVTSIPRISQQVVL
jgi:hypothetical protein